MLSFVYDEKVELNEDFKVPKPYLPSFSIRSLSFLCIDAIAKMLDTKEASDQIQILSSIPSIELQREVAKQFMIKQAVFWKNYPVIKFFIAKKDEWRAFYCLSKRKPKIAPKEEIEEEEEKKEEESEDSDPDFKQYQKVKKKKHKKNKRKTGISFL